MPSLEILAPRLGNPLKRVSPPSTLSRTPMHRRALFRSLAHRAHSPAFWGAVAVFAVGWGVFRYAVLPGPAEPGLTDVLLPLALLAGHLYLAPLPWQWTGDDRPMAPWLRGFLGALPWNTLWLALLLLTFQVTGWRPPHPPPGPPGPPPLEAPVQVRHPDLFFLLLNLPMALLMGWFVADRERAQAREEALQAGHRQAQARALQAQLSPHALFNAISGLAELVHEDPDAAEEALVSLADLLRRLMHHAGLAQAPLAEERELVKAFLAVEQIRLGERLKVTWAWPDWADALELPPLLLQPLVENAVKHGIAPHPEGGELAITVAADGVDLLLRVANTGMEVTDRPAGPYGLGLGNLRDRLGLLPELKGRLTVRSKGGHTTAELRFPRSGRLQLTLPPPAGKD